MNSLQNTLTKEILELEYKNIKNLEKIAKKLNVSIDSIRKYMRFYQIKYRKSQPKTYHCNETVFSTDTEVSFYLAGFIAADGCVRIRQRKSGNYSKILSIGLSKKDEKHLNKIRDLLESNHPIVITERKPTKKAPKPGYNVSIEINSENIVDDLNRFNIVPAKTKIYKMPNWLLSHKLLYHFMRGYFDGDGSVGCYKRKNCKKLQKQFVMMGTFDFVKQYQDILVNNCRANRNKIFTKGTIYSIGYSGNGIVERIYSFLYHNASIFLDRKYEKISLLV